MQTNSNQTTASICDEIKADGWREYPSELKPRTRCFYKTFETLTRCHQNSHKPGIAIRLNVTDFEGFASMELDLRGGLADGTWLMLLNYGLPKTVPEVTAMIPRLLAIWEAANKFDSPKD